MKRTNKNELQLAGLFMKMGGKFEELSKYHWRMGQVDFWPTTGSFHIRDMDVRGKLNIELKVDPSDPTPKRRRVYIPNSHSPL